MCMSIYRENYMGENYYLESLNYYVKTLLLQAK